MSAKFIFSKNAQEVIEEFDILGIDVTVTDLGVNWDVNRFQVESGNAFLSESAHFEGRRPSVSASGKTPDECLLNLRQKFQETATSGYLAVAVTRDQQNADFRALKYNSETKHYDAKGMLKI